MVMPTYKVADAGSDAINSTHIREGRTELSPSACGTLVALQETFVERPGRSSGHVVHASRVIGTREHLLLSVRRDDLRVIVGARERRSDLRGRSEVRGCGC